LTTVILFQHGGCAEWAWQRSECLEWLEVVPHVSTLHGGHVTFKSGHNLCHSVQDH
jgi:hypothetical protein